MIVRAAALDATLLVPVAVGAAWTSSHPERPASTTEPGGPVRHLLQRCSGQPCGIGRGATPGFAVDRGEGRAYVAGGGTPLAEVTLDDLAVSYHELARPVSR